MSISSSGVSRLPLLLSPRRDLAKPKGFDKKAACFLALSFFLLLCHSAPRIFSNFLLRMSRNSDRGYVSSVLTFLNRFLSDLISLLSCLILFSLWFKFWVFLWCWDFIRPNLSVIILTIIFVINFNLVSNSPFAATCSISTRSLSNSCNSPLLLAESHLMLIEDAIPEDWTTFAWIFRALWFSSCPRSSSVLPGLSPARCVCTSSGLSVFGGLVDSYIFYRMNTYS